MKKLILSLSPRNIFSRIFSISKEIYFFFYYIRVLKKIKPELDRSRIVQSSWFSLIKAVNLKAETLLLANKPESEMDEDEKNELHKLELSFISREIAKHNDVFVENGVIELIKSKANRVKNKDYYGYMVEISYNWKSSSLYEVIRLLFQLSIWVFALINIPYISVYNYIVSLF